MTISSPLEAHKSHTIVYDTVSVDVGYENPLFAVLEVLYHKFRLIMEILINKIQQLIQENMKKCLLFMKWI